MCRPKAGKGKKDNKNRVKRLRAGGKRGKRNDVSEAGKQPAHAAGEKRVKSCWAKGAPRAGTTVKQGSGQKWGGVPQSGKVEGPEQVEIRKPMEENQGNASKKPWRSASSPKDLIRKECARRGGDPQAPEAEVKTGVKVHCGPKQKTTVQPDGWLGTRRFQAECSKREAGKGGGLGAAGSQGGNGKINGRCRRKTEGNKRRAMPPQRNTGGAKEEVRRNESKTKKNRSMRTKGVKVSRKARAKEGDRKKLKRNRAGSSCQKTVGVDEQTKTGQRGEKKVGGNTHPSGAKAK